MTAKQWRNYLDEFPEDAFGDGDTQGDILADLEATENKIQQGIEAMLKFALGQAYDEESASDMKSEAARLITVLVPERPA